MLERLSKADPGVEYNLLPAHSAIVHSPDAFAKEFADLSRHVAVNRIGLHGLGCALHVHADIAGTGLGHEPPKGGFFAIGSHIIDDAGPRIQRGPRDAGFDGVDGDRHFDLPGQSLNDGQHAAQLFGFVHRQGSRARGFAANIDNLRALLNQFQGVRRGGLRVQESPAVEEGVWSDVHDTHHQRWARENELELARAQDHEAQTRNPKPDARMKPKARSPKPEKNLRRGRPFGTRPSAFFRISGFGIRIFTNPRRSWLFVSTRFHIPPGRR